jgi:hypothetical protein
MRRLILSQTFSVVVGTAILIGCVAAMTWWLHEAGPKAGRLLFLSLGVLAMSPILLIAAAVDRRERHSREDRQR